MEANLAQLQSCMYQYSRAIYRSIKDLIDPYVDQPTRLEYRRVVLCECEETMSRLAQDPHYFAKPDRALFQDIRRYFPITAQAQVAWVVKEGVSAAVSFIEAQLEAGLLDGGVATTHWAQAKTFARRYPEVDLRVSEILTEQNHILCSGAVTTSLNLALRLVEKFAGPEVAAATGKMMLIDTNRVSQSSYASLSEAPGHSDALVARAQRWMEKSLNQGFSLSELARHLAVSERTLNRRFKLATGEAPLHHLQSLRVDVAKRLLATTGLSVEAVSARVGYSDLSTFRRLFRRETGLSPREYQRRFSRRHAGRGAASGPAAAAR